MTSLESRQYFPVFDELPLLDEYVDPAYYADVGGGTMLPVKHWCFFADIVDDALSHMPDFFHRVEARDLQGTSCSILFAPDQGLDHWALRRGSTVFVRYAAKAYFSDLLTQVVKVDDVSYVKVVGAPMDELLLLSQWYFGPGRAQCAACRRALGPGPGGGAGAGLGAGLGAGGGNAAAGGGFGFGGGGGGDGVCSCAKCDAAMYCSRECRQRHAPEHAAHCAACRELCEVLDIDAERFVQAVPFGRPPPQEGDEDADSAFG